ncbi:hypothetical protein SARC_15461, partial [Sphaeroforma arctica JP610]
HEFPVSTHYLRHFLLLQTLDVANMSLGASSDIHDYGPAPYIPETTWVDWSSFGVIFSTGVFSLLFQHSVP